MKLFPTIEEVFESPNKIHKTLFFPLLTINLEEMEKGKGLVHFVSVWGCGGAEPFLISDDINYGFDFIKFDWTGERYVFDNHLFAIEYKETLLKWHSGIEKEYLENKSDYLTPKTSQEVNTSNLVKRENERAKMNGALDTYAKSLINYWVTRDKYFETGKLIQGSAYTHAYDDEIRRAYISLSKTKETKLSKELVGKVCGYNYKIYDVGEIGLYIDRKQQKVFQKFKWD